MAKQKQTITDTNQDVEIAELRVEVAGLKKLFEERLDGLMRMCEATLVQVTKTNGRVTMIELWKERLRGMWAVLLIIGGGLVTIIALLIEYVKK